MLPSDAEGRKAVPMAAGVLDYFPDALVEVARVSKAGNDQHNPGQPLHWDKSKSTDHADCIVRHLVERGTYDADGMLHSAKVAWRALALLQTELEARPVRPGEEVGRGESTELVRPCSVIDCIFPWPHTGDHMNGQGLKFQVYGEGLTVVETRMA